MAAVTLECPICGGTVSIDSRLGGQQLACPLCRQLISVPALPHLVQQTPPAPPQPPPVGGLQRSPPLSSPPPIPAAPAPQGKQMLLLGCPTCAASFEAPRSAGGTQLFCPQCHSPMTVPRTFGAEAPAPPPVPPPTRANEPRSSRPLPATASNVAPPRPAPTSGGTVVLPTADGRFVAVPEPAKVVGSGEREVEIRRLTPEERAQRRLARNLFLLIVGGLVLLGALYAVMRAGPW
jgi:hypothetical protein